MNSFRRALLSVAASLFFGRSARGGNVESASPVIDDLGAAPPMATIGTEWRLFTDTVMGGVSKATMTRETVAGRPAIRLRGDVSLENNGGFVQIALDFRPDGAALDAGAWRGIQLDVFGNDEDYALALRTADLTRPWQSYRQSFRATPQWTTVRLPFDAFVPNRTETPLNLLRLRRLGVIGVGRKFTADISIGAVGFFRD